MHIVLNRSSVFTLPLAQAVLRYRAHVSLKRRLLFAGSSLRPARPRRRGLGRLRYDSDLVVDLQGLQQVIVRSGRRRRGRALLVNDALRDDAVRRVHVVLELLVHAKCRGADGTFVRQVRGLQRHAVISCHVVQQFPLVHLKRIFPLANFPFVRTQYPPRAQLLIN